jgi:pilus assembly protein CpaB
LIVAGQENVADMPEGAITTQEELEAALRGKLAAGPIDKNAIISRSQWVSVTVEVKPLATQIPSGKQAMTISTDAVRGVNGFVEPGDRVNLIITVDIEFDQIPVDSPIFGVPSSPAPGGEGGTPTDEQQTETITYTRYVLQGLPVLAVGRDIRAEGDEPQEVQVTPTTVAEGGAQPQAPETVFTLEVSPEEAERLAYSFENGSVWLTLVPSDFVKVDTEGVTIETLFTGDIVEDIFG